MPVPFFSFISMENIEFSLKQKIESLDTINGFYFGRTPEYKRRDGTTKGKIVKFLDNFQKEILTKVARDLGYEKVSYIPYEIREKKCEEYVEYLRDFFTNGKFKLLENEHYPLFYTELKNDKVDFNWVAIYYSVEYKGKEYLFLAYDIDGIKYAYKIYPEFARYAARCNFYKLYKYDIARIGDKKEGKINDCDEDGKKVFDEVTILWAKVDRYLIGDKYYYRYKKSVYNVLIKVIDYENISSISDLYDVEDINKIDKNVTYFF